MKNFILFLLLTLPMVFVFTQAPSDNMTCDAPQNVTETSSTTTSITYSWDAVLGATGYVVYYTREEDSYTSSTFYPISNSYTFSNLSLGTYDFFFATDCEGEVSENLIIEDVAIM